MLLNFICFHILLISLLSINYCWSKLLIFDILGILKMLINRKLFKIFCIEITGSVWRILYFNWLKWWIYWISINFYISCPFKELISFWKFNKQKIKTKYKDNSKSPSHHHYYRLNPKPRSQLSLPVNSLTVHSR